MTESGLVNGTIVTYNCAKTWNYFRGMIHANYADLFAGGFNTTIRGTPHKTNAVCFKLGMNYTASVGFCTYNYLLDIEAVGTASTIEDGSTGPMTPECQVLLS